LIVQIVLLIVSILIANSDDELNANSKDISEEQWDEVGAITGHNGPVKGLDWSPEGEYLISAGYVIRLNERSWVS
jgi:hypothetical protein